MALIAATAVQTFLGISTEGTNLATIASFVDKWIKNYLGRDIEETTYSGATGEKISGDGTDTLILTQYPITSDETAIVIVEAGTTLSSDVWYNAATYENGVYKKSGIIKRIDGGVWAVGNQNITVTYKAGYATAPVDITFTALMMAVDLYNEMMNSRKGNSGPIQSEKVGQYAVTYASLASGILPEKYKAVLDNYRRRA